jgi:Zn-dependent protease
MWGEESVSEGFRVNDTANAPAPGPWGSREPEDGAAPRATIAARSRAALGADEARRISPRAIALALLFVVSGAALALMPAPPRVLTFIFVVVGWLLSLIVHEFGHAYTAWRGGDTSVPGRGYLTLDPLRYIDNITTLALPLAALAFGGIGLPGGAVQLQPELIRSRGWLSATSLAGPAGTLIVLLALAGALFGLNIAGLGASALAAAVAFLAFLQATALIINLLPIPGLDGYGALHPFLPLPVARVLAPLGAIGIIALFVSMMFVPDVGRTLFGGAISAMQVLGVPPDQLVAGLRAFQFWR